MPAERRSMNDNNNGDAELTPEEEEVIDLLLELTEEATRQEAASPE